MIGFLIHTILNAILEEGTVCISNSEGFGLVDFEKLKKICLEVLVSLVSVGRYVT